MNEKNMGMLKKIKKDCIDLEKNHEITDFGRGQFVLVNLILESME